MMLARLDMAALRALLIGVLCVAVMAFRGGGLSPERVSFTLDGQTTVSVLSGHHHDSHSHDDDPAFDADASQHGEHTADHSHDIPGNPAFMGFRVSQVKGPEPSLLQLSELRDGPSGIHRPPWETLHL